MYFWEQIPIYFVVCLKTTVIIFSLYLAVPVRFSDHPNSYVRVKGCTAIYLFIKVLISHNSAAILLI